MKIEILGMGCQKCATLYELVKKTVDELNIKAEIIKIEDFKQIMQYGVMTTPALVINGEVKMSGRIPSKDEIQSYLK